MRRGLVAASAALVLLVACDRDGDDPPSPTSTAGGLGASPAPSASSERGAAMQMRQVKAVVEPSDPQYAATTVTCGDEGRPACTADELRAPQIVMADLHDVRYRLGPIIVDGNDVAGAEVFRSPFGEEWAVECVLTAEAADGISRATARIAALASPRNTMAIVAGGRVVSAPTVQAGVPSGRIQLTGVTETEAKFLARRLGGSVA